MTDTDAPTDLVELVCTFGHSGHAVAALQDEPARPGDTVRVTRDRARTLAASGRWRRHDPDPAASGGDTTSSREADRERNTDG